MYKGAKHQVSANNCRVMYVLIPAFLNKKILLSSENVLMNIYFGYQLELFLKYLVVFDNCLIMLLHNCHLILNSRKGR